MSTVILPNLSPAQADGLACVLCGADFLAPGAGAHRPVGRSASDSQVFACSSHTPGAVREAIARGRLLAAMDAPVSLTVTDQQAADVVLGLGRYSDAAGEVA